MLAVCTSFKFGIVTATLHHRILFSTICPLEWPKLFYYCFISQQNTCQNNLLCPSTGSRKQKWRAVKMLGTNRAKTLDMQTAAHKSKHYWYYSFIWKKRGKKITHTQSHSLHWATQSMTHGTHRLCIYRVTTCQGNTRKYWQLSHSFYRPYSQHT